MPSDDEPICLRVQLSSRPAVVYGFLATDAGRRTFWAASAPERENVIHFRFLNGLEHAAKILAAEPGRRFAVEYFGGSHASFDLDDDDAGGTIVTLTERSVPDEWRHDQRAGWVTVLLALKAAADHGIDLRNHDPTRPWEDGFVDV